MSIDHEMERIGRIVAADQGLTVRVRGSLAYATRGEVTVPAIETYTHLGKDAERMLHGLLDHECAHATDTDFDIVEKSAKKGPAFKSLFNAIEDGYIEGRQGLRYLGCADNLREKNTWFWTRAEDGKTTPELVKSLDTWGAFVLATTMVVRPHGGQSIEAFKDINPEVYAMLCDVEGELKKVALLFDKPRASEGCYRIAERIYKLFEDRAEEAKERAKGSLGEGEEEGPSEPVPGGEEPEAGQKPESGEEAPGDGEGSASSADSEGAEGEGESEGDAEEGKPEESPKSKRKAGEDMELPRWQPPGGKPLNPEEAIQRRITKVFEPPSYVRPYIVFSHEWDAERDFSIEQHPVDVGSRYEEYVHEAREATDALISTFEVALRAKKERRPVANSDEGEVDVSLLAEYAVGAAQPDRIFCDYVAEDETTAAVAILVDCSGSMGNGRGQKSDLARLSAIALHRALQAVQIPHEVSGFTTIGEGWIGSHAWSRGIEPQLASQFRAMRSAYHEAEARGTDFSKFARSGGPAGDLEVPFHAVFKGFGGEDARGLVHIAGIGNNLDGEGVLWQARRLARRPEHRRVMFVLSDGYPAGSHDNAQGARYLSDAVKRCIEAGIEVYGIGMQSRAVEQFYPQHWVCNDMAGLAQLAFGAISEVLLEHRQERAWVSL